MLWQKRKKYDGIHSFPSKDTYQ